LTWLDTHLAGAVVQSITREVVEELRALKRDETTPATADRCMALLRAILKKCADDWQVMESAPKVPMYGTKPSEPRWLTRSEFEKLCKVLPTHLELAARLAVSTGLRMQSMLSMTWDRVDLKAKRAWIAAENMKAGRTHGLPLNSDAVQVLKRLRKLSPEGNHVFQWRGEPIADCNTKTFQDAVTAAGVGPLRWHDLRHTWASWAVQGGVALHELMQLGGWASYSMVLRYAHLAPDHLASAAQKVADFSHKNRHTKISPRNTRISA
jgi:integrase